jgi:NADPH:quinone reductase-like Zn-dependent oxidoreductase
VIPVTTDLDWATLGALPEMLQTAHGSLHTGLAIEPGQSLPIRGGTSSVGVAAAVLAKEHGYGGESSDLPAEAFQRYVDLVADGKLPIRIDRVFTMDEIGEAHRIMQDGGAVGKLVVRVEGPAT